jgi:riboflavin biosynthesis pyrimidine reductase
MESVLTDADLQLSAVLAEKEAIYGDMSPEPRGVIHTVSAVRRRTSGRLHVIKIQPGAPHSDTDGFVLRFWRAHYDAILTTGQILRAEPALSYAQDGPLALGLTRYREQVLGKSGTTRCAILTRSLQLSAEHPVFQDSARIEVVVLCPPQIVADLRKTLGDRAEVVGLPQLDARAALDFLKRTGSITIGVEAGPSVAGTLYGVEAEPSIEHLMLSICEGEVPEDGVGGELPVDDELFAGLQLVSDVAREEDSGVWRFQRWQRAESVHRPAGCQNR